MTDQPYADPRGSGNSIEQWSLRLLQFVGAAALFLMMVMTCIDVIGRYLFSAPLDGATELTRLLMAVIIFSVLPIISRYEEHVTVDLLDKVFPLALVRWRQLIINLISAVALSVVAWRVWILAVRAAEYGDYTEYLEIPLAPFSFFMSIMSGVTAAALFVNVVRYLIRPRIATSRFR